MTQTVASLLRVRRSRGGGTSVKKEYTVPVIASVRVEIKPLKKAILEDVNGIKIPND